MFSRISTQHLIGQHLKILRSLQYKTGLFAASKKDAPTGYNKSWLRDNFYECLAFQAIDDWDTIESTMLAIMKIFEKHEYKIDIAIKQRPTHKHEYIHARYDPESFDEFWEEWGNKQNVAVGAVLFLIGELEKRDRGFLKPEVHQRLVQKLVYYLGSIEFWHDIDSGMWEENEEVHASSIGACIGGLKSIKEHTSISVPDEYLKHGYDALGKLLPRESNTKFADLAQLSLIWPYHVVGTVQTKQILENIEYHLLREHGVIRYKNDHYYNKNPDGYSEEAEWCFGLSWLCIIYEELGEKGKAKQYLQMMLSTVTDEGIPELYFSHTDKHNANTPLGWSESLFVLALYHLGEKYITATPQSHQ